MRWRWQGGRVPNFEQLNCPIIRGPLRYFNRGHIHRPFNFVATACFGAVSGGPAISSMPLTL